MARRVRATRPSNVRGKVGPNEPGHDGSDS